MLIKPDEADRLIRQSLSKLSCEPCELADAIGRIVREDIVADRDLPPFDRVTMDGYALRFREIAGGRRSFSVGAVQRAGSPPELISDAADSCIEVMTGASLPMGADCVVPYEETERVGDRITVTGESGSFQAGHAIHFKGSDFRQGATIVRSGATLASRELAVAAACGKAVLSVSKRPRITILVTGDELMDPGATVAPWQLRRSNDIALQAALCAAGYPRVVCLSAGDTREGLVATLAPALERGDWVVTTGAVSKGKFDMLPGVFEELGVDRVFHGIAQRPGKPLWFGISSENSPVFALPGNPVSSFVCLHRYVIPALAMACHAQEHEPAKAELAGTVTFEPELTCFLPVRLDYKSAGRIAIPVPLNSSGDFTHLVGTDGFVVLPSETDAFPAGTTVDFWPWA